MYKKLGDLFVHYGKVINGTIKVNENVEMKIKMKHKEIIQELITQQLIYYMNL